jgi:hypothetical protein
MNILQKVLAEPLRQSFGANLSEFLQDFNYGNSHRSVIGVAPRPRWDSPLRDQRFREFGWKEETLSEGITTAQSVQAMDGASQPFVRLRERGMP